MYKILSSTLSDCYINIYLYHNFPIQYIFIKIHIIDYLKYRKPFHLL